MSLYLWLHIFTVSFPLLRSFEPRIAYASRWKALFPGILLTGAFFIIWDVIFTRNGVWGFNSDYLTGIFFFNLPIEEWLFFVTVPFASIFIYDCLIYFDKNSRLNVKLHWLATSIGALLIIFAGINYGRDYTFYNFLFAGLLLLAHGLLFKVNYLGHFFVAYIIHLIPFILVNGILTGGVTETPVVWYNNEENLGWRIWTIPAEDTIYALLLLLMNITYYEFFKSRFGLKHN
jgi:lycopene cyclase domain-containing protein